MCKESAVEKCPKDGPPGLQFRANLVKKRLVFVHPECENEMPGLQALLESTAELPGSGLQVANSFQKLKSEFAAYREGRGVRSKPWLQMRALMPGELVKAHFSNYPNLCCEQDAFFDFLCDRVDRAGVCPGTWR